METRHRGTNEQPCWENSYPVQTRIQKAESRRAARNPKLQTKADEEATLNSSPSPKPVLLQRNAAARDELRAERTHRLTAQFATIVHRAYYSKIGMNVAASGRQLFSPLCRTGRTKETQCVHERPTVDVKGLPHVRAWVAQILVTCNAQLYSGREPKILEKNRDPRLSKDATQQT